MSDTFGPDDLMKWEEMTKKIKEFEAWGAFLDGFSRGTEARFDEVEKRVHNLEAVAHTPGLFPDAWDEKAFKRIQELERDRDILSTAVAELQRVTSEFIRMQAQKVPELASKVESLTRTLDMWQEIMGIEVVVYAEGEAEHV